MKEQESLEIQRIINSQPVSLSLVGTKTERKLKDKNNEYGVYPFLKEEDQTLDYLVKTFGSEMVEDWALEAFRRKIMSLWFLGAEEKTETFIQFLSSDRLSGRKITAKSLTAKAMKLMSEANLEPDVKKKMSLMGEVQSLLVRASEMAMKEMKEQAESQESESEIVDGEEVSGG